MGVGAAVRSFQARICSSATKDSPFIHVSTCTKCVLVLTFYLEKEALGFFQKTPAPSIQKQMVAPLNDFVCKIDCQMIF